MLVAVHVAKMIDQLLLTADSIIIRMMIIIAIIRLRQCPISKFNFYSGSKLRQHCSKFEIKSKSLNSCTLRYLLSSSWTNFWRTPSIDVWPRFVAEVAFSSAVKVIAFCTRQHMRYLFPYETSISNNPRVWTNCNHSSFPSHFACAFLILWEWLMGIFACK